MATIKLPEDQARVHVSMVDFMVAQSRHPDTTQALLFSACQVLENDEPRQRPRYWAAASGCYF